MLKKEQLEEWCKILNSYHNTLIIDRVFDDWIYTTWRNLTLKNHDRLYRSNADIQYMLWANWFKYIDCKITISLNDLYKKFPQRKWMEIEWVGTALDNRVIYDWLLEVWQEVFSKECSWLTRKVISKSKIKPDWQTLYIMTAFGSDDTQFGFEIRAEEAYEICSLTKSAPVSRDNVANALWLINQKLLVITE